jgi:hypothetical protein
VDVTPNDRKELRSAIFHRIQPPLSEVVSRAPSDIRDPKFELAGRSDRERLLQLAHAYLDLCFEQWHLYQRGLVTSKLWSFWKSGMTAGFSRPAFQQSLDHHSRGEEMRQEVLVVRGWSRVGRPHEGATVWRMADKLFKQLWSDLGKS